LKLTHRAAAGATGVAATALLHILLVTAALWGSGSRIARLPDAVGSGANSGTRDGSATERIIIVQLSPDASDPRPKLDQTPQLTVEIQKPSIVQVTGPDSLPLPPLQFDEQGTPTEASEADLIARTKLAGLYESQIRARIERAWSQPTETLRSLVYACRVKVRQQRNGEVMDVSLESCEGSFQWLNSLVQAIYSASPLPGAPHPGVFTESFSMQFRSVAAR
jgi:hypothetical protein